MRITYEILRPVPIAPLTVQAGVARGGRSVEMVEGELLHDGTPVIRARGWRIRTTALDLDVDAAGDDPPAAPSEGAERPFFPTGVDVGYHRAMDVRFLSGGFTEPGPARAWMRMRVQLVQGEEPTPLARVLAAADSGNGVSAPLDFRRWVFINTDLSVTLRREPRGEWVCLDAVTWAEPDGTGTSDTALYDEEGFIGRASQALLVAPRST